MYKGRTRASDLSQFQITQNQVRKHTMFPIFYRVRLTDVNDDRRNSRFVPEGQPGCMSAKRVTHDMKRRGVGPSIGEQIDRQEVDAGGKEEVSRRS